MTRLLAIFVSQGVTVVSLWRVRRKMLFRAPCTSNVKGRATPVNVSEELGADSVRRFDEAAGMTIANLDTQLDKFREDIKRHSGQVQVVRRPGYSGGGAFGLPDTSLLVVALVAALRRRGLTGVAAGTANRAMRL